jgi:hypothetical protein
MERNVVEAVVSVLRRDGNVLLPVDASGRVLELILLLNQHWERNLLANVFTLVWLGPMVGNTAELARAQLEWMSLSLGTHFDTHGTHWFALKHVHCVTNMADFTSIMESQNNPTCVVASGLDLEAGPARDILLQWADNPDHAVIFTDSSGAHERHYHPLRSSTATADITTTSGAGDGLDSESAHESASTILPPNNATMTTPSAILGATTAAAATASSGATAAAATTNDRVVEEGELVGSAVAKPSEWTVAGQLLSAWATAQAAGQDMDDVVPVDIPVPHRSPLSGAELQAFLAHEEEARQKQMEYETTRAMLREVELAKGQLRLIEEDSDKHIIATTAASKKAFAMPRKKSRFDANLFLKFSKPLHRKL